MWIFKKFATCILQRLLKFIINIHRWRCKSRNHTSVMLTVQSKYIQQSASVCHISPSKFYLWLSLPTYGIRNILEKIVTIQKTARWLCLTASWSIHLPVLQTCPQLNLCCQFTTVSFGRTWEQILFWLQTWASDY